MINFILLIVSITLIIIGIFYFLKKQGIWKYIAVLFIFLSCMYFILIFYIAKLMQDSFK